MGIIVNQPASNIKFPDLLVQLEVIPAGERSSCRSRPAEVEVLKGGPVEPGAASCCTRPISSSRIDAADRRRHLPDRDARHPEGDRARQRTATPFSRSAMPAGRPASSRQEIQDNGWLHCAADPELIFGDDTDGKYDKALRKLGIDLGQLSSQAGHA